MEELYIIIFGMTMLTVGFYTGSMWTDKKYYDRLSEFQKIVKTEEDLKTSLALIRWLFNNFK